MQQIFRFFNSPLVVVLIGVAVWPYFVLLPAKLGLTYDNIAKQNSQSDAFTLKNGLSVEEMETLTKKIKIENVGLVTSSSRIQKVVGTVHNTSYKTLKEIALTISFYDETNELIDVAVENLRNIEFLGPGDSIDFSENHFTSKEQDNIATSVSVRLTSFALVKAPKDE